MHSNQGSITWLPLDLTANNYCCNQTKYYIFYAKKKKKKISVKLLFV